MQVGIKETWRIPDIVISALIFIISFVFVFLIFEFVSNIEMPDGVGFEGIFLLFPIAFLYKKYPFDIFSLKLDIRSTLIPLLIGFVVFYVIQFPFPPRALNLEEINHFSNEFNSISELVRGKRLFLLLNLIVITPILSELYFRGYIYRILKNRYDVITGGIVSSIIYSVMSFQLEENAFLGTFILGLLLAYVYEKSNSIIVASLVHSSGNVIWLAACYWGHLGSLKM